jgi:hypothetical protein
MYLILLKNELTILLPHQYYTKYLIKGEKSIPQKYKELLGGNVFSFFNFFIFYKTNESRAQD